MARKPSPPTKNMREIMAVLAAGPLTWRQIQAGMEGLHGAVLQGILARMIDRGLIQQDGEHYRLMET